MSAYIVDKAHIDALVQAAGRVQPMAHSSGMKWFTRNPEARFGMDIHEIHYNDKPRANEVGQMLWDENHKSVNARYNQVGLAESYTFQRGEDLAPIVILNAIDGYEYQSCEHVGWHDSEAKAFCDALRLKMTRMLPGYRESKGWSLTESDVRPTRFNHG